jgi:hypothetical protein
MAGIRTNYMLDEDSLKSSRKKRPFSTSALVRFWLKILVHNEDELYKLKKTDEEFAAIMAYLAPKLKRIFGG